MRPSIYVYLHIVVSFAFAHNIVHENNAREKGENEKIAKDAWVEDISEDHSSIILPHYDLYDYEDSGNWTEEMTEAPGNNTGVLHWVRELVNLTKEEGEGLKLRCEVEGEPGPVTVRWLRNEAPIEAGLGLLDRKRLSIRTSQAKGRINSRLRIVRLETHDSGFYTCLAKNGLGLVSRTTGVVMVKMTPWGHDGGRVRQSNFPLHPQKIDRYVLEFFQTKAIVIPPIKVFNFFKKVIDIPLRVFIWIRVFQSPERKLTFTDHEVVCGAVRPSVNFQSESLTAAIFTQIEPAFRY